MQFGVISACEFFKNYKLHLPYKLINTKLPSKSCYHLIIHIFS